MRYFPLFLTITALLAPGSVALADLNLQRAAPSVTLTCAGKTNQVSPDLRGIVPDPYCCNVLVPQTRLSCLLENGSVLSKVNELMLNIRSDLELGGICNFPDTGDPGSCPAFPQGSNLTAEIQAAVASVDCEVSAFASRSKTIESSANTLKQFVQSHCGN